MSLETACALAAVASLFFVIPAARRSYISRDAHVGLAVLALGAAYVLLAVLFVVDLAARQPLPATLRFARGYAAGIAVGFFISAGALWAYDRARRRTCRTASRGPSSSST